MAQWRTTFSTICQLLFEATTATWVVVFLGDQSSKFLLGACLELKGIASHFSQGPTFEVWTPQLRRSWPFSHLAEFFSLYRCPLSLTPFYLPFDWILHPRIFFTNRPKRIPAIGNTYNSLETSLGDVFSIYLDNKCATMPTGRPQQMLCLDYGYWTREFVKISRQKCVFLCNCSSKPHQMWWEDPYDPDKYIKDT